MATAGLVTSIGSSDTASIPATVQFGSRAREVDLMMVPEADVGDYVIVHSGFAIRVLPPGEPHELLDLVGRAP